MKKRLQKLYSKVKEKKQLRIPFGILSILIGIAGGFIPIFQGWIFILLGCTLIFGEKFTEKIKNKFTSSPTY